MLNLHEDILEEFASFATTTEDLPTFHKAPLRDRKIWSWRPEPGPPAHILGGMANAIKQRRPFTDGVRIYLSQRQAAQLLGKSRGWVEDQLKKGRFVRLPGPPPKPSAGR